MEKDLLELAKKAIEQDFHKNRELDTQELSKKYPQLLEKGACFATLELDGNLRGCIGSIIAHRPLIDDIIHNAKAAAFEDVRFPPLSQDEFQRVQVELSLLSTPQKLTYSSPEDLKEKIKPSIHGVILQKGSNQATFLPQVWEQLPTFEAFFSHLCQKAGLGSQCLKERPDIWTYSAQKIK